MLKLLVWIGVERNHTLNFYYNVNLFNVNDISEKFEKEFKTSKSDSMISSIIMESLFVHFYIYFCNDCSCVKKLGYDTAIASLSCTVTVPVAMQPAIAIVIPIRWSP